MAGNSKEFASRKLHSLLGVIPVGLFLIVHLTVNYLATRGADSFNAGADFMESLPYLIFFEIVLIYLPLLYHGIYGVYIAFTGTFNAGRFGYFRNWMYILQRVTGIITFIFLIWHVWETRVQIALGNDALDYNMMVDILSNPWMLAFYIVGVISAVFHFSNGLWSFAVTWGITVSPRSQRISAYVVGVVFILLAYVAVRALLAFV
ncbi:succinate dehydrogenase cytochrome b558 subunit [Bacillus sp. 1P06AnD]|uniref:succinate dehydrogenase cytochrome b558 subunit n=1 Tax=Bacillus sp. 1P06AnD TaxID=3132208 RepID=UPI0039A32CBC